jgi:hypothetical protein
MKKVSKKTIAWFTEKLNELEKAFCETESRIHEANAEMDSQVECVNEAISDYNTLLDEFEEGCAEVEGDIRSYMDERSEKWQESDRGQLYETWADGWGCVADERHEEAEEWNLEEAECVHPGEEAMIFDIDEVC